MRDTALQPPPPTPITLMRVPVRASSSSSYFRSSMSMSPSMMPMVTSSLQHFFNPGCLFFTQPGVLLQFCGIHRESRGGTPHGIVQFEQPILNAFGETEARLALENLLGSIAQARQLGSRAGEEDAADESTLHPDARELAAHKAEQLFGTGRQDAVDSMTRHFARLAIFGRRQLHQDILGRVL